MCRRPTASPDSVVKGVELADILRASATMLTLSAEQHKVVGDIVRCRTAALGGHLHRCNRCSHEQVVYNSCCNRHCPKCQKLNQARWLDARQRDLLPVTYYHVVFTIPHELLSIFLRDRRTGYRLLFAAVSETLGQVALNPKRLGARIGFTAILHTWTQKLLYHPHIHCVVTGGGLSPDGSSWIDAKDGFFLPVRVLSLVFRGKLLSKLEGALRRNELQRPPPNADDLLRQSSRKNWVVYCKAPFAGPKQVLNYLGRYTHRIAITNERFVAFDGQQVTLTYRDRTDDNKRKTLTLDAAELSRRFLLHVVPKRQIRIRHYGLLANPVRNRSISRCRELLGEPSPPPQPDTPAESWEETIARLTGADPLLCPECKAGRLVHVGKIAPAWDVRPP